MSPAPPTFSNLHNLTPTNITEDQVDLEDYTPVSSSSSLDSRPFTPTTDMSADTDRDSDPYDRCAARPGNYSPVSPDSPPTSGFDSSSPVSLDSSPCARTASRLDTYSPVSPNSPFPKRNTFPPSPPQSPTELRLAESSDELNKTFTKMWGKYDPNTVDDDEIWDSEPVAQKDSTGSVLDKNEEVKRLSQMGNNKIGTDERWLPQLQTILEDEMLEFTVDDDDDDDPEASVDDVDGEDQEASFEIGSNDVDDSDEGAGVGDDDDDDRDSSVEIGGKEDLESLYGDTDDVFEEQASQDSDHTPPVSAPQPSRVVTADDQSISADYKRTKIPGLTFRKRLDYSEEEEDNIPSSTLSVKQDRKELSGSEEESQGTEFSNESEESEEEETPPAEEAEYQPQLKRSEWLPNLDKAFEGSDANFESWGQKKIETVASVVVGSGPVYASTTGPLVMSSDSFRRSTSSSAVETSGPSVSASQYASGTALSLQSEVAAANMPPSFRRNSGSFSMSPPKDEEQVIFSGEGYVNFLNEEELELQLDAFKNQITSGRDPYGRQTSAFNSGIHHFNYFGYGQPYRADPNSAISLRLILRGGTHLLESLSQTHSFRQGVLSRDLWANIDPVIFLGSRAELETLMLLEPKEFFQLVEAKTSHFYNKYGDWEDNPLDLEKYRPCLDAMSLTDYQSMEAIDCAFLNGWYNSKNSNDLLIADFWAKTECNASLREPDVRAAADRYVKKRDANLKNGFKPSRLRKVANISDEEEFFKIQSPASKEGLLFGLQMPINSVEDQDEDIWEPDAKSSRTSEHGYQYLPSETDSGNESLLAMHKEDINGVEEELNEEEEEVAKSPTTDDQDSIWTSEDEGSSVTSSVSPSSESPEWNIRIEMGDQVHEQFVKDIRTMDAEQEGEDEDAAAEVRESSTVPAIVEKNEEAARVPLLEAPPHPTTEPEEKLNPYWNKLRMQVPIKATPVEIAKPKKRSFRKSIKKAVWKLAPLALRPAYAS